MVGSTPVANWLESLGPEFLEYAVAFIDNGFSTVAELVESELSADDLKEVGLSKMRHRKAVLLGPLTLLTGSAAAPTANNLSCRSP